MHRFRRRLSAVTVGLAVVAATPAVAQGPQLFFALTPCRVVDTRNANGPTGGPVLASAATRNFPIKGSCGVPAQATVVAVNATAVGPTGDGYITLFASGTTEPAVVTVVFRSSVFATANNAIVNLSSNPNDLSAASFVTGGGTVHLIIDVTGYFAPVS